MKCLRPFTLHFYGHSCYSSFPDVEKWGLDVASILSELPKFTDDTRHTLSQFLTHVVLPPELTNSGQEAAHVAQPTFRAGRGHPSCLFYQYYFSVVRFKIQ